MNKSKVHAVIGGKRGVAVVPLWRLSNL